MQVFTFHGDGRIERTRHSGVTNRVFIRVLEQLPRKARLVFFAERDRAEAVRFVRGGGRNGKQSLVARPVPDSEWAELRAWLPEVMACRSENNLVSVSAGDWARHVRAVWAEET